MRREATVKRERVQQFNRSNVQRRDLFEHGSNGSNCFNRWRGSSRSSDKRRIKSMEKIYAGRKR